MPKSTRQDLFEFSSELMEILLAYDRCGFGYVKNDLPGWKVDFKYICERAHALGIAERSEYDEYAYRESMSRLEKRIEQEKAKYFRKEARINHGA